MRPILALAVAALLAACAADPATQVAPDGSTYVKLPRYDRPIQDDQPRRQR
jgi:type IV pilus biogenesis protein CpaD/CtpE